MIYPNWGGISFMENKNNEEIKDWKFFDKIVVVKNEEEQKVLVNGKEYMRWSVEDQAGPRMAIVQLYKCGVANQEELSKIFGIHNKTVYNYITTFETGGISSLVGETKGPKESWKITSEVRYLILDIAFRNRDISCERISELLLQRWKKKISKNSIREVLLENGFIKEEIRKEDGTTSIEGDLFKENVNGELELEYYIEEGESEKTSVWEGEHKKEKGIEREKEVVKNKDRSNYSVAQRIYLDQIERASLGFQIEKGEYNTYAGGLLFAPLLMKYNFLPTIKRVIDIDTHEGYNLEEFCLTLFYYDIFGFNSIENFKTVYPEEFGILIGKLSSPGIWALRQFLHKVRKLKKGEKLIEEFAKEYLKNGLVKFGVLYIDGQFWPYHGIQEINMGYDTVRDKTMKGSYNFIAVDEKFNPVIFLVRASSEDLLDKISEIINKVREIAKQIGIDSKELIVIFDREGYCAELFRILDCENVGETVTHTRVDEKVKFISWAKYADQWVYEFSEEEFKNTATVKYEIQKSEEIKYFETERTVSKYGKIRAIVIQSGRKKYRTAIYTNATSQELSAETIIQLICRRWGQENVNKALKINHYIDYYPGKGLWESEEIEEQPMVDNPALREIKQRKSNLVSQLHGLELKLAKKILKDAKDETNWKEIKIAENETLANIAVLNKQITMIDLEIEKLPKEIKYEEARGGRKLFKLDYEKKRFLDCIKVFAYHMQKKMCEILLNYYDNRKEIYPALDMIIRRGANVRLEHGELIVRLKRFKDPEVDYASRHLCEDLNKMNPVTLDKFHLPIYYEVA